MPEMENITHLQTLAAHVASALANVCHLSETQIWK